MRVIVLAAAVLTAACSGPAIEVWTPPATPPPTNFVPPPRASLQPDAQPAARPPGPGLRNDEPRIKSINPLPEHERRDLQRDRQALDNEIEQIRRRARFDDNNLRADERRQLRDKEADRNRILRQLRGNQR